MSAEPRSIPAGLTVRDEADALVITKRSNRRTGALLGLVALVVLLAVIWVIGLFVFGPGKVFVPLGLFTVVALILGYPLSSLFFSRTELVVERDCIATRYAPLGHFFETRTWPNDVVQIYSARPKVAQRPFGELEVRAILKTVPRAWIVAHGLDTPEQARFIEGAIERRIGVADRAVVGELERPAGLPIPPEPALEPPAADTDSGKSFGQKLVALAGSLFVTALASVALLAVVGKRGESVGRLDLLRDDAQLVFEARAGDRVKIYADVDVDESTHPQMTRSGLQRMLDQSRLSVRLGLPGGSEREQSCVLYAGIAEEGVGRLNGARISGSHTSCNFTVDAAGSHRLRGNVVWPAGKPREAKLDVRIER